MAELRGVRARQVAEEALAEIGAWSVNQTEAREHEVQRALMFLAPIVGELASTNELHWLGRSFIIPLIKDQQDYDLVEVTRRGGGEDGGGCTVSIIEHWKSVWLITGNASGNDDRDELTLLREPEWYGRHEQSEKGEPRGVWIERRLNPILHCVPIPDQDDRWRIELVGQIEPAKWCTDDSIRVELPDGWRRWLRLALAHDVCGGAVNRLPQGRKSELKRDAEAALRKLLAYSRPEHRRARLANPYGFADRWGWLEDRQDGPERDRHLDRNHRRHW